MKYLIAIILFLSFVCWDNEAQDNRIKELDKFLEGQTKYFRFNGNVLVAEKGIVVYKKSFGFADYADKTELNDSTVFDIASITKQFTAMGILLLVKEGKLSLTDSLRKFFPELPYSGVTIHHMLTQTSGLPDFDEVMEIKWDQRKIAFNRDVISLLSREKPSSLYKPGAKWRYSNTGYTILASIIEVVSGETFEAFLRKQIFGPLKMKHSRILTNPSGDREVPNMAHGYVWSDSLQRLVFRDSLSSYNFVRYLGGIQGGGSIFSTTGDLLKWNLFLTSDAVRKDSILNRMFFPHTPADYNNYGYGVYVANKPLGESFTHPGHWAGFETNLTHYTEGDRTIIVLSNNNSRVTPIQRALAFILFNKSIIQPYHHKVVTLDSVTLNKFAGTYGNENMNFRIVRENKTLFQISNSGQRLFLSPESKSKLFTTNKSDWLDFQFEMVETPGDKPKYYQIRFGVKAELEKMK